MNNEVEKNKNTQTTPGANHADSGISQKPSRQFKSGDSVNIEIEKIGTHPSKLYWGNRNTVGIVC
jgi:hypothetical protein